MAACSILTFLAENLRANELEREKKTGEFRQMNPIKGTRRSSPLCGSDYTKYAAAAAADDDDDERLFSPRRENRKVPFGRATFPLEICFTVGKISTLVETFAERE